MFSGMPGFVLLKKFDAGEKYAWRGYTTLAFAGIFYRCEDRCEEYGYIPDYFLNLNKHGKGIFIQGE